MKCYSTKHYTRPQRRWRRARGPDNRSSGIFTFTLAAKVKGARPSRESIYHYHHHHHHYSYHCDFIIIIIAIAVTSVIILYCLRARVVWSRHHRCEWGGEGRGERGAARDPHRRQLGRAPRWFAEAYGCPGRNHREDGQNNRISGGGSVSDGDVLFRVGGRSRAGHHVPGRPDDGRWADDPSTGHDDGVRVHGGRGVGPRCPREAVGHQHTEGDAHAQGGGRRVRLDNDDNGRDGRQRNRGHVHYVRPGVAAERVQPAPVEPRQATRRVQVVRPVSRRHEDLFGIVTPRIVLGGQKWVNRESLAFYPCSTLVYCDD